MIERLPMRFCVGFTPLGNPPNGIFRFIFVTVQIWDPGILMISVGDEFQRNQKNNLRLFSNSIEIDHAQHGFSVIMVDVKPEVEFIHTALESLSQTPQSDIFTLSSYLHKRHDLGHISKFLGFDKYVGLSNKEIFLECSRWIFKASLRSCYLHVHGNLCKWEPTFDVVMESPLLGKILSLLYYVFKEVILQWKQDVWPSLGKKELFGNYRVWEDKIIVIIYKLHKLAEKCLRKKQHEHKEISIYASDMLVSSRIQDSKTSPTTFQVIFLFKVMLNAFWSFIAKMIAIEEYVKEGHNRFLLLAYKTSARKAW